MVTLALLLGQLYAPLTALASARRRRDDGARQLRAGVRGARPRTADHRARRTPSPCRRGPVSVELDDVRLRLPVRRQGVAGVARGGRDARRPRRRRGAPRRVVPRRARPDRGAGRHVGWREVDDRLADPAPVRRRQPAPCGSAASTSADLTFASICARRSASSPRTVTCSTTRSRENLRYRPARGDRRRAVGCARQGPPRRR